MMTSKQVKEFQNQHLVRPTNQMISLLAVQAHCNITNGICVTIVFPSGHHFAFFGTGMEGGLYVPVTRAELATQK